MVSNLFKHVCTSFEFVSMLAEILGFYVLNVIWFLVDKLMILLLFVVILVVVMLEFIMVTCWCVEIILLCGVGIYAECDGGL